MDILFSPRVASIPSTNHRQAFMDEETAYHEAGHIFAAHFHGGFIRSATIAPDKDEGPARFGDVQVEWRKQFRTQQELIRAQVQVALAGPAAEMVYLGSLLHTGSVQEWSSDWQTSFALLQQIVTDQAKIIGQLERNCVKLFRLFQRDDVWCGIAAVADELLAHETIEDEQIAEILNFWNRHFQ